MYDGCEFILAILGTKLGHMAFRSSQGVLVSLYFFRLGSNQVMSDQLNMIHGLRPNERRTAGRWDSAGTRTGGAPSMGRSGEPRGVSIAWFPRNPFANWSSGAPDIRHFFSIRGMVRISPPKIRNPLRSDFPNGAHR